MFFQYITTFPIDLKKLLAKTRFQERLFQRFFALFLEENIHKWCQKPEFLGLKQLLTPSREQFVNQNQAGINTWFSLPKPDVNYKLQFRMDENHAISVQILFQYLPNDLFAAVNLSSKPIWLSNKWWRAWIKKGKQEYRWSRQLFYRKFAAELIKQQHWITVLTEQLHQLQQVFWYHQMLGALLNREFTPQANYLSAERIPVVDLQKPFLKTKVDLQQILQNHYLFIQTTQDAGKFYQFTIPDAGLSLPDTIQIVQTNQTAFILAQDQTTPFGWQQQPVELHQLWARIDTLIATANTDLQEAIAKQQITIAQFLLQKIPDEWWTELCQSLDPPWLKTRYGYTAGLPLTNEQKSWLCRTTLINFQMHRKKQNAAEQEIQKLVNNLNYQTTLENYIQLFLFSKGNKMFSILAKMFSVELVTFVNQQPNFLLIADQPVTGTLSEAMDVWRKKRWQQLVNFGRKD